MPPAATLTTAPAMQGVGGQRGQPAGDRGQDTHLAMKEGPRRRQEAGGGLRAEVSAMATAAEEGVGGSHTEAVGFPPEAWRLRKPGSTYIGGQWMRDVP